MLKRAVITGATGMLGRVLSAHLLDYDYEVLAVARPQSKRIVNLPCDKRLKIIECDANNLDSLSSLIDCSCDVFYHFAWDGTDKKAREDARIQQLNIKSTLDAVKTAFDLGCKVFIGAGSQAEYGATELDLNSKVPVNPQTSYGIAKYCAGKLSHNYAKQLGIKHIWTRVLSVYGPYDNADTLIMSTIAKMLSGEKIKTTKAEQLWDYLYSEDAARAFKLIGEKGKDGAIYCLGSGKTKSILQYLEIIKNEVNKNAQLGIGELDYPLNQVMYLCADISDLQKDVGFEPQVDFQTGIKNTVQWVKKYS